MADRKPQTLANHTRTDPSFHFVFFPMALTTLGLSIALLIRHRDLVAFTLILSTVTFLWSGMKARIYAMKVQDRVIRLEERLRLMTVLPPLLHHRIAELTEPQLVALRFASDNELMALTARVLEEKLEPKQIKAAIVEWRPDYFRV